MQAMFDKEVSHLLSKKEAEEQLASLQQRKEALHAERDGKKLQRSQLELQLIRVAQRPHTSELIESRSGTQPQVSAQQAQQQGAQPGSSATAPSHCRAREEDSQMSCQQGESGGTAQVDSAARHSSQQEEEVQRQAAVLDDAVDTCEAQLTYLDSTIAKCKAVSPGHCDMKTTADNVCNRLL